MFTGLIEEKGKILQTRLESGWGKLKISAKIVTEGTLIGDSICVNGVCLTVTEIGTDWFSADVMNETLQRSNLGLLSNGDFVNLERAMAVNGRFGGHIVSGHIDGTGHITGFKHVGNAVIVSVSASEHILSGIVEKGSITLDGISLTVVSISERDFSVSIIPHTGEKAFLLNKKIGDAVNIENDIIGKYVQKFITQNQKSSVLTSDFLKENGF